MIRSISSMSSTMPGARRLVARLHLDAEPQPRERRAQVVRDAGEQQRAVLLELAQVGGHPVHAAIERDDLRRAVLGQRRRRLAAADALDGRGELAQRAREIAREDERGDEQHGGEHQAPQRRARRVVLGLRARRSGKPTQ